MSNAELFEAHAAARRVRAEWIAGLEQKFVTLNDLLQFAASGDDAEREAVRRMRLTLALAAYLGSRKRAEVAVRHTVAVVEDDRASAVKDEPKNVRVGWLLDRRTNGKRIMALADALTPKTTAPVTGFPFRTEAIAA